MNPAGERLALDRRGRCADVLRRRHDLCVMARTGLWLLGAVLTVDLIFQGWGLIAVQRDS